MKIYICENCGKEHDGSYGSGRFCSKQCRGAFVAKNQKTGCKANKSWQCEYCGLVFTSRAKWYEHKHKEHSEYYGHVWNKGLTKETDRRIYNAAELLKKHFQDGTVIHSFAGKHLTDEHKNKIIKTYEQNRTLNKYRGFYNGIYFQYSFELAWLVWNIEHGNKVNRCTKSFKYFDTVQKKIRRYYPDFELPDGTIVEIKGRMTQNVIDKQNAVINEYHEKYQLLFKKDIQICLDYCKKKYGNNFLQKLKD